ncbi:MAG TPA: hypothetical protein VGC04_08280 [Cellulomonas sp.]
MEIQHRHQKRLTGTPGVTGFGAALVAGRVVLRVFVDPDAATGELPDEIEGLPVVVERTRIEPL